MVENDKMKNLHPLRNCTESKFRHKTTLSNSKLILVTFALISKSTFSTEKVSKVCLDFIKRLRTIITNSQLFWTWKNWDISCKRKTCTSLKCSILLFQEVKNEPQRYKEYMISKMVLFNIKTFLWCMKAGEDITTCEKKLLAETHHFIMLTVIWYKNVIFLSFSQH